MENRKNLLVFDSNSVLYRAYHALPPLTTKKGELVNGIYGFLLVFFKLVKEFQPNFVFACFDFPAPTFRHQKFKEYKINRPPTPKELSQQIPKLKEVLEAFGVRCFEKEGFEADDLIGTISQKSPFPTIIVSGDSDLLQLVDEKTKVYLLKKGVKESSLYDLKLFRERFENLEPSQILDLKALVGDPSDNIPGVKGIGKKTAFQLLKKFQNLENLYQKIEQEKKLSPKIKKILLEAKEQIFLAKELLKLKKANFDFEFKEWELDEEKAKKILSRFEFQSLIKRLPEIKKKDKIEKEQSKQKRLFDL